MGNVGKSRHRVTFTVPASVPDGDGGYIDGWRDLDPPWDAEIVPANVRDLERRGAGTVIAAATHVVTCRYRADVTIAAEMRFKGRTFRIAGVKNVDERGIEMELFVIETVQP